MQFPKVAGSWHLSRTISTTYSDSEGLPTEWAQSPEARLAGTISFSAIRLCTHLYAFSSITESPQRQLLFRGWPKICR